MICCWVREGQTLSEDREPLTSIFEEKRRGGREGDEEEGLRDLRVGFGSRDRGSDDHCCKLILIVSFLFILHGGLSRQHSVERRVTSFVSAF